MMLKKILEKINILLTKDEKGKLSKKGIITYISVSLVNLLAIACFVIAYMIPDFQNWFVTTALSTGTHQYFARVLYDKETIREVVCANTLAEPQEIMDSAAISIGNLEIPSNFTSIYEQQVLERNEKDLYKVVELDENGYHGYVVFVYDPKRISLATANGLGTYGETVSHMAQRTKAKVATNAGGRGYRGGKDAAVWPSGYVYKEGKVVYQGNRSSKWSGGTIGFSKEGVLILTKSEDKQAIKEGIYNGVDFGPFLIVNGTAAQIKGVPGGKQPRTCIGQRQDGIVVMLVIEGRSKGSAGVNFDTVIDIFQRYEVYNAANLDGGGSSELVIEGNLMFTPKSFTYSDERFQTSAWIVK